MSIKKHYIEIIILVWVLMFDKQFKILAITTRFVILGKLLILSEL